MEMERSSAGWRGALPAYIGAQQSTVAVPPGDAGAWRAASQLPELLDPRERLVLFIQAICRKAIRAHALLVLTDRRLLVIGYRPEDERVLAECSPAEVGVVREFAKDPIYLTRMDVVIDGAHVVLRNPFPASQALRLQGLLGGSGPGRQELALLDGLPADPGCPPFLSIWAIDVYADRLVDETMRQLPLDASSHATVDSAGNIAAVRGRNLAAKGASTLVLGGLGLLMVGNAKTDVIDTRELWLLVEGERWAYTKGFSPDSSAALRDFAAQFNAHVRTQFPSAPEGRGDLIASGPSLPEQLVQLKSLHEQGVLSDAEFAKAKAQVLEA